jgi:hypothetical protein
MICVAMFDEVDKGTAIFKCANDVPNGEQSTFITFEGLPNDFYLKLVGKSAKLIRVIFHWTRANIQRPIWN